MSNIKPAKTFTFVIYDMHKLISDKKSSKDIASTMSRLEINCVRHHHIAKFLKRGGMKNFDLNKLDLRTVEPILQGQIPKYLFKWQGRGHLYVPDVIKGMDLILDRVEDCLDSKFRKDIYMIDGAVEIKVKDETDKAMVNFVLHTMNFDITVIDET